MITCGNPGTKEKIIRLAFLNDNMRQSWYERKIDGEGQSTYVGRRVEKLVDAVAAVGANHRAALRRRVRLLVLCEARMA